jgi:hypothetical protein
VVDVEVVWVGESVGGDVEDDEDEDMRGRETTARNATQRSVKGENEERIKR